MGLGPERGVCFLEGLRPVHCLQADGRCQPLTGRSDCFSRLRMFKGLWEFRCSSVDGTIQSLRVPFFLIRTLDIWSYGTRNSVPGCSLAFYVFDLQNMSVSLHAAREASGFHTVRHPLHPAIVIQFCKTYNYYYIGCYWTECLCPSPLNLYIEALTPSLPLPQHDGI